MSAVIKLQPRYSDAAEAFLARPPQLFIDGQWVDPVSDRTLPVIDPSTGERVSVIADVVKEDIDKAVAQRVRLAEADVAVAPGTVWIAPGGVHLGLRRSFGGELRFVHDPGPRIGGLRPAADVLFGAAARLCGAGCVAAVLTGAGSDGCEGARHIVAAGGRVFVQDRESSTVWGMPGSVVRAQLASGVLALPAMATELSAALRHAGG